MSNDALTILSMNRLNRPRPRSRPPPRNRGKRIEDEEENEDEDERKPLGSWSQCMRESERRLSRNQECVFIALAGLFLAGSIHAYGESDAASNPAGTDSPVAQLKSELRDQGWIAYSARSSPGDWDLFAMRPDGSERRAITKTPDYNEGGVRFSPAGAKLLYYRMPKNEPLDNNTYGTFELVIARADGSNPEVYGKDYQWASWGPDGRQIACLSQKGIQIVDLASRKVVRQLPRRGIVQQLVWSPDGKCFVGTANGLGPFWNIGVLNADSGSIQAVSETERYNCTPDWVPDSGHVVYARGIIPDKGGHAELWVATADGKERWRIYAEAGRHIYGACASPDGKCVLLTRSVEDLGQVKEILMAIIRWPKNGESGAAEVPRLDLGPGWEPHWTGHDIQSPANQ